MERRHGPRRRHRRRVTIAPPEFQAPSSPTLANGGGPLRARDRIALIADSFVPWPGPVGGDPLGFPGYNAARAAARDASGVNEAVVTGEAEVGAATWCVIALEFGFIGGSMGVAVGARVAAAYDRARVERLPVLVLATSGGARMQEGMVALVQMARTAAAARYHAAAGLLQVAYLCSPTTGGVYASFASLADLVWGEPGATIGFAGPRVVEQLTGEPLPSGAHTAESARDAGILDDIFGFDDLRHRLTDLAPLVGDVDPPVPVRDSVAPAIDSRTETGGGSAWEQVQAVRAAGWPRATTIADEATTTVAELRGDRAGAVDDAVRARIARTRSGQSVMVLVLDGRPRPAGYRLAVRAVALASRLGLPLVTFVDTPGADPSPASEQSGIAGEIARLLAAIATHAAPSVAVVTGEGGSGGALAFAATDRLYLLEGAVFSVIAPEGAAAILHRDATRAAEVAPLLKLTGPDLVGLGIIDGVIAHADTTVVVDAALAALHPGDGRVRFDAATARWLIQE